MAVVGVAQLTSQVAQVGVVVLRGGACAAPARAQAFGTRAGAAVLASLFMQTMLHDLAQRRLFHWIADF